MSRQLPAALRDAIDTANSYYPLAKAVIYPSRVFCSSINYDNPITGADAIGILDAPIGQDIGYSTYGSIHLVTFVGDTVLKYAVQGSSTLTDTAYGCVVKPGVVGSKLYAYDNTTVKRYAIDWSLVASRNAAPLTQEASVTPAYTIDVVHGVSDTEAVVLARDNGGFRPIYISGTTQYVSDRRFVFPVRVDWDNSSRTMREMALFSGAARLGDKIFVFISNASLGTVEGIYYDLDTATWSDIYTALPTELEVSLCEFRIANVYVHNSMIYMCGQFRRTDAYQDQQPYSLLLYSRDGKTFSIDRFTLVSNIGYRFLALVGLDHKLYLANSNRVCSSLLTWVFDGIDGTWALDQELPLSAIKSITETNLERATLSLKAGLETYFPGLSYLAAGAKLVLFAGMKTSDGDTYVEYATYIVSSVEYAIGNARRETVVSCVNEAQWRLSGLTMPFYAEFHGKSSDFDPMTEESGKLYAAPGSQRTVSYFQVDMWGHVGYTNDDEGITGIESLESGGVNYYETTGAHKLGMITGEEIKTILGLDDNPTLTATSITVKIYGWSHPTTGSPALNDQVEIILITEDEDGAESTTISNAGKHWPITYPFTSAGFEPISFDVTGLTVGHKIKKIGLMFYTGIDTTWFNIARVEVTNNVEVPISYDDPNTPWESTSEGVFKVPHAGRPFIMFAQKPYNAWSFDLSAIFTNSVTGGVAGYPTACGVIGHAEDASNFMLGRFNKTTGKAEIVLCRDGTETVKADATPSFAHYYGDDVLHGIRFYHRDGLYVLQMWSFDTSRFEDVVDYAWLDTDGFMFTSRLATMKCGIYGNVAAPFVRTLGYYAGDSETTTNADGFPVDPMFSLADFPSSGTIRVGDDTYSYTGKIDHPTVPRGPYQFRQCGIYNPPYGDGSAGLEVRDFDWTASDSLINGYLIALDSGANFIASGAEWNVFDKDGGTTNYRYNRARYYSENSQISELFHTLANKVWVVGGFSGIALLTGTGGRHSEGEMAVLELSGEITCQWFSGAGGQDDTTVADLVNIVSGLCGTVANFPGDFSQSSLAVSGETLILRDYYADGFDLSYELAAPLGHEIRTNIKINSENYENSDDFDDDTGCKIVIFDLGSGDYYCSLVSTPSGTVLHRITFSTGVSAQKFRVLVYEDSFSVYCNGSWVTTFCLDELIYNQANYIDISAYGTLTLSNVLVRELGDWREAVYIDLETDGKSALGAIIQERPVDIVARPDGQLDFSYDPTRDETVAVRAPRGHRYTYSVPSDGASDAIIYGSDEVITYQNPDFAETLGFSTKLMRFPNLNAGALEASVIVMKRLHESRRHHYLVIRPDLSLAPGDVYTISYTASGTGRVESCSIILESVKFGLKTVGQKISSEMTLEGREQDE